MVSGGLVTLTVAFLGVFQARVVFVYSFILMSERKITGKVYVRTLLVHPPAEQFVC